LLTARYLKAIETSEGYADGEVEIAELRGTRTEMTRLATSSFRRYRARPWSLCVQRQFARVAVLELCSDGFASPVFGFASPGEITFPRQCWLVARSRTEAEDKRRKELQARSILLHDLFGNPFPPITVSTLWLRWNEAAVIRLAQTAYDERTLPAGTLDNTRLVVLADALEEEGCTDEQILTRLRGGDEHYRGCFVVDALLGKN
jgi:hypothetical protein